MLRGMRDGVETRFWNGGEIFFLKMVKWHKIYWIHWTEYKTRTGKDIQWTALCIQNKTMLLFPVNPEIALSLHTICIAIIDLHKFKVDRSLTFLFCNKLVWDNGKSRTYTVKKDKAECPKFYMQNAVTCWSSANNYYAVNWSQRN